MRLMRLQERDVAVSEDSGVGSFIVQWTQNMLSCRLAPTPEQQDIPSRHESQLSVTAIPVLSDEVHRVRRFIA